MAELKIEDGKCTVGLSYDWGESCKVRNIELVKEVCMPCDEHNYYQDVTIELNREDALKLIDFLQSNLDNIVP